METPYIDPKGRNPKDFSLYFLLPEICPSDEHSESSLDLCEIPWNIKCFVVGDGVKCYAIKRTKSTEDPKEWIISGDFMDCRKGAENCHANAEKFVVKNDFRESNIKKMDGGLKMTDFQENSVNDLG